MRQMLKLLTNITKGKGKEGDVETLEALSETAIEAALCALGKSSPNPFLSTLKYFRDEYEAHVKEKRCPALVVQGAYRLLHRPREMQRLHHLRQEMPLGSDHRGEEPHPYGRSGKVHEMWNVL